MKWTEDKIEELKELLKTKSVDEISVIFNTTRHAVKRKANILKISILQYLHEVVECKNCNKSFECRKSEKRKFCSKTCGALYYNSFRKKPKKIKPSKEQIEELRKNKTLENWKNITKKEFFDNCKNYFSARCTITKQAKLSMTYKGVENICSNCGYDKHVEICHIKAVSEFRDEETMFDINRPENLIYLCPNCHWEFDNKILKIGV